MFGLLDSPVKYTQHIGGTRHFNYETEPILDVLVGVDNLHDITALDEKRLNYAGFIDYTTLIKESDDGTF